MTNSMIFFLWIIKQKINIFFTGNLHQELDGVLLTCHDTPQEIANDVPVFIQIELSGIMSVLHIIKRNCTSQSRPVLSQPMHVDVSQHPSSIWNSQHQTKVFLSNLPALLPMDSICC